LGLGLALALTKANPLEVARYRPTGDIARYTEINGAIRRYTEI
jgi:hypothetical protein